MPNMFNGSVCMFLKLTCCMVSMSHTRTVLSFDTVVTRRLIPSTLKPKTLVVCDLISVWYPRLPTSRYPTFPVVVAASTLEPSEETHTKLTGPSCSINRHTDDQCLIFFVRQVISWKGDWRVYRPASKKTDEKSKGHRRMNPSSEPVTQNSSHTLMLFTAIPAPENRIFYSCHIFK